MSWGGADNGGAVYKWGKGFIRISTFLCIAVNPTALKTKY